MAPIIKFIHGVIIVKKTLRAVAYPRYSSDNQREESIDAQMQAIQEYCDRKGYTLVGSYPDEARSATTDNRPNFQRMIADSEKDLFDVVLVHKLDRFARDRYDSAYYKRQLRKNGVRLESVLEHLDNSPESIILESVLEGMAEYYSKNLARESRKGMLQNASKAIHAGGRPPYGYRINPETLKLEVDAQAAKAVLIYFQGVAEGRSTTAIADTLNELGYRTQTGRRFTRNSFDGWARNKKYIGIYTWDIKSSKDEDGRRNNHRYKPEEEQIQVPGAVPAIIPVELFEKVNELMETRKLKPGRLKAKQVYLLAGKIVCGQCGMLYRGESYRNSKSSQGTILKFYKCGGRCGNTNLRKSTIEESIIQNLVANVFSEDAIKNIVVKVKELYQKERESDGLDLQPIRNELNEINRKLENWVDALGEGDVVKDLISQRIREATNRKKVLESELERISMMATTLDINEELILEVLTSKKNALFSLNEEEQKQVVQEFVDRIVILPSKSIDDFEAEVTYKFFEGKNGSTTGKNPSPVGDRFFNGGGEGTPTVTLLEEFSFVI